jgi:hypothetical protein
MSGNGKKIVRLHPAVAEEFRKITSKLEGISDENRRLATELQDEKRAREALERQEVHIDDMPGKQLPFKFQINIPLVGGSNSPVTGTVNVSRDGPFICRRIYASVLVTDAPLLETQNLTEDYTHMVGRYVPPSSRGEYFNWARDLAAFVPVSYVPPPLDFEWEYNDSGSERNRQDKPISGDILAVRRDDDGYLMNNEIFAAGTTINFICSPTRAVPILTLVDGDETASGPIDLEVQITFDGFKVLQPLEM